MRLGFFLLCKLSVSRSFKASEVTVLESVEGGVPDMPWDHNEDSEQSRREHSP